MKIGEFQVQSVLAGEIRLDGGAMFGVVPKVLWAKKMPPDEQNRIHMAMNTLLIQGRGATVLVDTGAGKKEEPKIQDRFGITRSVLEENLQSLGVAFKDVDYVLNTHLHFDHAGGNTDLDSAGNVVPTFPKARYLAPHEEFSDALKPHERNRASYFSWNYEPLFEEGRMELVDGETEVIPGVSMIPLPGHTRGMCGIKIQSQGRVAFFLADCVPTHHHLALPWIMAYDLEPVTTLETKRKILHQAFEEDWILFFEHDLEMPSCSLEKDEKGRLKAIPVSHHA